MTQFITDDTVHFGEKFTLIAIENAWNEKSKSIAKSNLHEFTN